MECDLCGTTLTEEEELVLEEINKFDCLCCCNESKLIVSLINKVKSLEYEISEIKKEKKC